MDSSVLKLFVFVCLCSLTPLLYIYPFDINFIIATNHYFKKKFNTIIQVLVIDYNIQLHY